MEVPCGNCWAPVKSLCKVHGAVLSGCRGSYAWGAGFQWFCGQNSPGISAPVGTLECSEGPWPELCRCQTLDLGPLSIRSFVEFGS
jgi:hypothetical protein